jgi:2-methylcitrate dehydratase PrpD
VAALAAFAADLEWDRVPAGVRDQLRLTVVDLLGVGCAGAVTAEHRRLLAAVAPASGPSRVLGADHGAEPRDAAWLNGVAACSLELDEGNKYSRGHPAVHAFPAVLAVAEATMASGAEVCAALLVGYEVGARMGAATRLHAGVHPHGTWGAVGAAAGLARLRRLDAATTAAAIDAAAGLAFATTFSSALDGNLVRNAWVGGANEVGMRAVQLAVAGHARNDGTAAATLGAVLGELDPDALDDGLGERWMITRGYFKRHASCAYTHPPADAALQLRDAAGPLNPADIAAITVETHHVAAALDRTFDAAPPSRLAAMFSIPWVTAVALTAGVVGPEHLGDTSLHDAGVAGLARRVRVAVAPDLDAALPDHRGARLIVELTDGRRLTAEVADPVGDADHAPFGPAEVHAKLARLLGAGAADAIAGIGAGLDHADDVSELLARLP